MQKATNKDVLKFFMQTAKPFRWRLFIVICLISASQIILLFEPIYSKKFFDVLAGAIPSEAGQVIPLLISLLVIILGLRLAVWFFMEVGTMVENFVLPKYEAEIEKRSFNNILRHSDDFFANSFVGSLAQKVRRISRAADVLSNLLVYQFLVVAILIIGALIVLFLHTPIVAFMIIVWLVIVVIGNYYISQWKLKYDERRAESDSEITAQLADSITNYQNTRLFTGHEHERKLFNHVATKLQNLRSLTWNLATLNNALQWLSVILLEFAVLYFAIHLWKKGQITLGDFVLYQGYLFILFDRTFNLGRAIRDFYENLADAKEMVSILITPFEVADTHDAKPLKVKEGRIKFEDMSFAYRQTRTVIKNFNLEITAGQKFALVGPSGSGKSTLAKLLLRLYDVSDGKILIDGQRILKVTQESLHKQVAYVPQDPILFHRSLLENIRYGKFKASKKKVIEAAKKARCHEFVKDLPDGYDTLVGERGIKLSGGERQRVAIARAILKNAPILILDEATSSLDSESEMKVQAALKELMKDKTVIVIAHRLSTILEMDQIVVMDKGQIIDQGTHQELLERQGLYKKLWDIQSGGFIQ